MKITKKTPIKALLDESPEVSEVLMEYGLYCVNCHFSSTDTLVDAADIHGLSQEDIGFMIKDVNALLKKSL